MKSNKYLNWKLKPKRNILCLGDYEQNDKRILVVSYPVVQFAHIYGILKYKTPVSPEVTKVILSCGLNNRSHTMGVLQILLGRVKVHSENTFPNPGAKITMINFRNTLPEKKKRP